VGSIRCKTHVALPRYTTNSELTSGAMDEMSQKVQQASKPKMPDLSTRWCWSASPCLGCRVPRPASRESNVSFHWGNGGNVWQGSKCKHSPTGTHKSRARAQQSVSSGHSSRGRRMKVQGMFKRLALTLVAVLSWILQPSKLATPLEVA
jgi:hypothetical protein